MAKRKLKVIPLHRFFQIMDWPSKVAFLLLFTALLGLCVGMVLSTPDPVQWSMDVVEVPAQQKEPVVLAEYEANFRRMTAEAEAYKENVIIGPRIITPKSWMVFIFVTALILGWGSILAGASYSKGYAIYGALLFFGLFTMIERMFEWQYPNLGLLIGLGQVVVVAGPVFLVQQGYLKMKFIPRLLLFTLLVAAPYLILHQLGGWEALHRANAEAFQAYLFFGLAFLFLIGPEINNLTFFLATNAKNRKYRASTPIIGAIFTILLGLQFMMLQDAAGWNLVDIPDDFPFRPMHLVAFSALVMVATKQNLYPPLKDYINNRGLTFVLLGLGLIGMGSFLYHSMLGEMLYSYSMDRLAIIILFLSSALHLIYMFINFSQLLRSKVNFYFISMMPRRLMYAFVVLATFLLGLGFEASSGFHSRASFSTAVYNRLADAYLVEGDKAQAMGYYNAAVGVAEGGVKGNYNLAMLNWTVAERSDKAEEHFLQATQFLQFSPAYLNLAALELESGVLNQAIFYLNKGLEKEENKYLHNNLAQMYFMVGEPDSAIVHTKRALQMDPENSTFYGNLATIYMNYERYDEAAKFFKAGLECETLSPMTVTNALYLDLAHGIGLDVDEAIVRRPEIHDHLPAWFNLAIDRFRRKDFASTRSVLDSLTASLDRGLPDSLKGSYRPPELMYLDGCVLFEEGEANNAISRMAFLDSNYPQLKGLTQHFLGAAYHGQGIPGMAAEFYRKSVENGRQSDILSEALMEIDRGNHDYGFMQLNLARSQDSTLGMYVSKEVSLLQRARGEYFLAGLDGMRPGAFSDDELIRCGIFAGQIGNLPAALEAFRRVIMRDSSSVTPYLVMGRISLENNDPLAKENIQPGLDLEPENIELLTEMARAHFQAGEVQEGLKIGNKVLAAGQSTSNIRLLEAEMALVEQDTSKAVELLKSLQARYPLLEKGVIQLSALLRTTDREIEAQNLVIQSLELNYRSPELELELARAELALGRIGEAAGAAKRAMALEVTLERIKRIQDEFGETLKMQEAGIEDVFDLEMLEEEAVDDDIPYE